MRFNHRLILFVAVLSLFVFVFLPSGRGDSSYSGPLFDAHSHLLTSGRGGSRGGFEPSRGRARPFPRRPGRLRPGEKASEGRDRSSSSVVDLLRKAGLSGVFLFGRADAVAPEHARNPDFAYPFVGPSRDPRTRRLRLDDEAVRFLEERLNSGAVRGIGEIPLRHAPTRRNPSGDANPADGPIPRRIYDLAARHNVPVVVHVEHAYSDELERALDHNPNAVIIWAHIGDSQPALARHMMKRHRNLFADISCRNPLFKRLPIQEQSLTHDDGHIKDEWKALFEKFPDRFLFGLDLGAPGRAELLDRLLTYYRSLLGELTPPTAEMIAHRNARRLLLGTKAALEEQVNPSRAKSSPSGRGSEDRPR